MSQKGFTVVEALLIIVIIGIIGFVGWRIYDATTQTNKDLDQAVQTSDQTPEQPSQISEDKLVIEALGVQITVSESLKNLTFTNQATPDQLAEVSVAVSDKDLQCDVDSPLGKLYKVGGQYPEDANIDNSRGVLIKQFDNFYIGYMTPQAACSADAAMEESTGKLRDAFREALKTTELII